MQNDDKQPSIEELKAKHMAQTLDFVHKALERQPADTLQTIYDAFDTWWKNEEEGYYLIQLKLGHPLRPILREFCRRAWLEGAVVATRVSS